MGMATRFNIWMSWEGWLPSTGSPTCRTSPSTGPASHILAITLVYSCLQPANPGLHSTGNSVHSGVICTGVLILSFITISTHRRICIHVTASLKSAQVHTYCDVADRNPSPSYGSVHGHVESAVIRNTCARRLTNESGMHCKCLQGVTVLSGVLGIYYVLECH